MLVNRASRLSACADWKRSAFAATESSVLVASGCVGWLGSEGFKDIFQGGGSQIGGVDAKCEVKRLSNWTLYNYSKYSVHSTPRASLHNSCSVPRFSHIPSNQSRANGSGPPRTVRTSPTTRTYRQDIMMPPSNPRIAKNITSLLQSNKK